MRAAGTEWVLLSRCQSVGHAELLLAAPGKHGVGGKSAAGTSPHSRPRRASEVLLEMERGADESSVGCRDCGEENPANFEPCWSCGAVLPFDGR